MELYKRLQYIRKIRGYTQQDVGEKFFVSRQAIQKWESGDTSPDISKLHELSIFYNVSLDVLLDNSLTEQQFKDIILKKNHVDDLTTSNIIGLLKNPSKTDIVITGVMFISTSLVIVTLHLIGVFLVLIAFGFVIGLGIGSIYFLINTFMNFDNGFGSIISNLGLSLACGGLLLVIYDFLISSISKYTSYVKEIITRLKLYIKLIKRINNEKEI